MKATVFPTCLVELTRPSVGKAVLSVLRDRGHEVAGAKGTTCCGQPAWNAGFVNEARRVARRTLKALARSSGPIVVPSGSCATMLREHWPALFAGTRHEGDAVAVAARVEEFSAFLAPGAAPAATRSSRVAYHDSCHMLRELNIRDQPRTLLAEAGITVVESDGADRCCGFGGTFAVKLPEISVAMADEKLDDVVRTGTGRLVGCDVSCLLHLQGRAERRGLQLDVQHLAEVLDAG